MSNENEGLEITDIDFENLPVKKQMSIIFKNQQNTLKFVRKFDNEYKFNQKIQYLMIAGLFLGFTYLIQGKI